MFLIFILVTITNDNAIADGIPMNLDQMKECSQETLGVPVALRRQGTTIVKCPCCLKMHDHGPQPGHHVAGCDDHLRNGVGIVVGERHFVPNYGYTICKHRETDGVNELADHELK